MMQEVVIVGGGTAGWLTAGILAAGCQNKTAPWLKVTLVESPDIPTIGVGEGTWPTMRMTLKRIGLKESDFISRCNASFKQGSKFIGWKNGKQDDYYYHPFTEPFGHTQANIPSAWRSFFRSRSFDDTVCLQGKAADLGLAPKLVNTPDYGGVLNYGYHLDAGLFSEQLKQHCIEKLGVVHISDTVTQVQNDDAGYITSITTKQSGEINGDFFVDCSGSQALLHAQHFNVPWVDHSQVSINDTALAVQVPYAHDEAPIASATLATAQESGWIWDIGLSSRRGVGYVYSGNHASDDQAESQLRDYLKQSLDSKTVDDLSTRKLTFSAGHRQQFWVKNCVAIGMAAGFIEPLEASALALVELGANMLRDELPFTQSSMTQVAKKYNATFNYRWQRIIEFLKLHYLLSERRDSDYWKDVTNLDSIPEGLKESLELWQHRPPYFRDLMQTEEIFPSASYQYVLYGMGFKSQGDYLHKQSDELELGRKFIDQGLAEWSKYEQALPTNRELIKAIRLHS